MAAHLEANPAACAVVNFTPVLLEQLTTRRSHRRAPRARQRAAGPGAGVAQWSRRSRVERRSAWGCCSACLRAHRAAHDRALRPVPGARHACRDARHARAHRLRLRPVHPRHRGVVPPRLARETVRRMNPLVSRLTDARPRLHRRRGARTPGLVGELVAESCRATARSPPAGSASSPSPRTATRSSRCCWTSGARARHCRRWYCRTSRLPRRRGARPLARRGGGPRIQPPASAPLPPGAGRRKGR